MTEAQLISQHIAAKGVTRCPPAYAAPVQGAGPVVISDAIKAATIAADEGQMGFRRYPQKHSPERKRKERERLNLTNELRRDAAQRINEAFVAEYLADPGFAMLQFLADREKVTVDGMRYRLKRGGISREYLAMGYRMRKALSEKQIRNEKIAEMLDKGIDLEFIMAAFDVNKRLVYRIAKAHREACQTRIDPCPFSAASPVT